MGKRYPAEFRQRAVELARQREKPLRQLALDLGISDQTHGGREAAFRLDAGWFQAGVEYAAAIRHP